MGSGVYSSLVPANGVLGVMTASQVFAFAAPAAGKHP